MPSSSRLSSSAPFWVLLAGSVVSAGFGAWLVVSKITTLEAGIVDGSATGVEVYGGQAWVTLGAGLVTAGLIGLVATLSLAVIRTLVSSPVDELILEEEAFEIEEPSAPAEADSPVVDARPVTPAPNA